MVILKSQEGSGMGKVGLIPLREAAEMLGININVMHGKSAPEQIRKYIYNKGTNNQLFDVNSYRQEKDEENEIIAKTTLFVEYLYYEEQITYIEMRRITKVKKSYIIDLNFSFKTSLRFIGRMCEHNEELLIKFISYYEFDSKFKRIVDKYCSNKKDV